MIRAPCLGLDLYKDQFASNTPEDVAVMLRPLTESARPASPVPKHGHHSWRNDRMYFLFTMLDNRRPLEAACKLVLSDEMTERAAVKDQPTGGARRDRTDDLMLAKHALSQLSYGPFRHHVVPSGKTLNGQSRRRQPASKHLKRRSATGGEIDGGPGKTRTSDLTLIKRAL